MGEQNVSTEVIDYSYVDDFVRVRNEVVPLHGWVHSPESMWCYVRPPGVLTQAQGWKIHVSATPRSAVAVLDAVSRVLLERGVAFKFAKGLAQLRMLLSVRCDRGAGGKFITVYPNGDEEFIQLLEELHRATEGNEGPAILSDRRYRAGSLVHYRYGGFSGGQQVLDSDGSYVPMLVSPSGGWTPDSRKAWYSPPDWAPAPIAEAVSERRESQRGKSQVKLDDRFVVYEAIRHSNRGGVYRAIDEQTGEKVVVKEARPFVAAEMDGTDARDFLRNEYDVLRTLEPLRVAVRPIALFDYQDHVFLAEEHIDGVTLRAWVESVMKPLPGRAMPLERVLPVAKQLVTLMTTVHDKGFVFRDFTPNNIMVTPNEDLVIIDTEFVAVPGQQVTRVMTMSYVAPEELSGPIRYPAPSPTADLYSLGASLFYLVTGTHALLPLDEPGEGISRRHQERIEFLVDAVSSHSPTLAAFAPIVLGLTCEDPARRLPLHRVQEMLETLSAPADRRHPNRLSAEKQQRLLDDGIAHLAEAMTPELADTLWPTSPLDGRLFDPLSLQAGAAGPVELLRRTVVATGDDGAGQALETAVRWLNRRLANDPRVLPGLYFGRAGTYWALYEAARHLGDEKLAERTLRRVKTMPVKWKNPDITHGVAGGGLAQLHLWRRTGDDELRQRVLMCVDSVLAARAEGEVTWPMPEDSAHNAGGLIHYGFAHGVAGISAFLLAVGRELDRPDLLDIASHGGDLLVSVATRVGDAAYWPTAQKEAEGSARFDGVCWWCSGGPGIGTFLVRLWRATGEPRFLDAAHQAAVATRMEKWLLSASHCHGLAGNGEFLLDMAAATGDGLYREWAEEYALALYRLTSLRGDRLVLLDDSNTAVSYSYNVGMSGPLGFLHRLRYGGPRWWMVDDFDLTVGAGQ
ncbi:class IV lanthionine synthetase LanL [Nonomuraea aurantiaca]|uniref:class IV lanthionine synthetase LanL n=1 Tax=Nonomuraea aurantiaca TaxID=2878562 RepID=UPI001CD98948|nr:class IV lanthionine synthetase LanL [Nonomuraea aurantiaca]MCA2230238.1 class IV lanthionine synthetase LanL [Nonomuraea aurantiaca]